MAKFEGELADVLSICPNCQYWQEYQKGGVSIEKMRENCALRCKQHPDLRNNKGIYKFDVVYAYLSYYLALFIRSKAIIQHQKDLLYLQSHHKHQIIFYTLSILTLCICFGG